MNDHDNKLRAVLRQWRDIEAPDNFEANVWRRIRLAQPTPAPSWAELLRRWVTQPSFALTAATIMAVVIGSTAGVLTTRQPGADKEMGLFSAGTLAGGYTKLMTRGDR
jgi:hypothetical protein